MRPVLVDTDVFSFLFKQDSRIALYAADLKGAQPCLSFQTLAELRAWALIKHWGQARRNNLDIALASYLMLPYDDAMTQHWAQATAHRRRTGRPLECGDAWIAASALRHNLPLLTHNADDYADIPGLTVVSHTG